MRSILRRCASVLLAAATLGAAAHPSLACVADCRSEGEVSIDDLIRAVNIALGTMSVADCLPADANGDGTVRIDELVSGVHRAQEGCALGQAGEVLVSTQGGQMDEYDLATGARTTIIPSTSGRVVGQICLFPDGSGNYVVGDDSGAPGGWGIYAPDGSLLKLLRLPALPTPGAAPIAMGVGKPVGCAVDASGRVFGDTVAEGAPASGRVWVFTPPDYDAACEVYPRETGTFLTAPGAMAIDDAGNLYIPEGGEVADEGGVPADVARLAPPFPNTGDECGAVTPTKSTFIQYDFEVTPFGIARNGDGHWFVSLVQGTDGGVPSIREHDAEGTFVREVIEAGAAGNPAGLAFDSHGTLFYSDLALDAQGRPTAGRGTLRAIRFAADGTPSAPELIASGLSAPYGVSVVPSQADTWLTLGGGVRRTFFNPRNRQLNPDTVRNLTLKWRYLTSGLISAQAASIWLDLPGEGRTQVFIVPSWDQRVYALRAENGTKVWQYEMKAQPGAAYPYAASPTIAWMDGQPRVFVPGGETLYCLDATNGTELWQFDAGTGCETCTARQERNEIEATPAVIDGLVIAAMDTNDGVPGKGGMFAVHASDGTLAWWFDLVTQTTCRPLPDDQIHGFDGYHSELELGLPTGFLATRPGCDFDRTSTACGNVWSSPAVDARRGLIYTASGNCDVDDDPETPPPLPPPPPYEEAIFAVSLNGDPAWTWRPREIDPDDFDFGAVPNLFEAEIGGQVRDLVGVGNKDGTYYVLDRDGVNQLTEEIEPYWQTKVVPGGPAGGMIGSASVGDGNIVVATAPGFDPFQPQKPTVHAFDPSTGAILWEYSDVDPAFGPTMGVPGLVITGGTPRPNLNYFTRDAGALLRAQPSSIVPGGIAAGPTIVGNMVVVGGGTGAFNSGSQAEGEARRDTPVSAFCIAGTSGCVPNTCDDGDRCTYDYLGRDGSCMTEPSADGIDCTVPGTTTKGTCASGNCMAPAPTPVP